MITFALQDEEYIELVKLLKATGLCQTGGEAKMVVVDGLVAYNGAVDHRKRLKVRKGDVINYNNHAIKVV